jgi:hypothetical protein
MLLIISCNHYVIIKFKILMTTKAAAVKLMHSLADVAHVSLIVFYGYK